VLNTTNKTSLISLVCRFSFKAGDEWVTHVVQSVAFQEKTKKAPKRSLEANLARLRDEMVRSTAAASKGLATTPHAQPFVHIGGYPVRPLACLGD
jgi:hypothetical protein